jgi:DNA-binding NarL/FixJ family response regulator
VAAIRTVMITMSPILRDLLMESMVGHVSLDLVGELETRDGLEEKLRPLIPDLIFVGLGRGEDDDKIGVSLARLLPNVKVILFSSDARDAFVHRMQPQRTILLDFSRQMLIDSIRSISSPRLHIRTQSILESPDGA